jgi:hypothetical protein
MNNVMRTASKPKKLFLAHTALQKQCGKVLMHHEKQKYIENAGLRCLKQEMERKRDKFDLEKRKIEEQRQRITKMLADVDSRRILFEREREKTMNEIRWLTMRDPGDEPKGLSSVHSISLGMKAVSRWKMMDRRTRTFVRSKAVHEKHVHFRA